MQCWNLDSINWWTVDFADFFFFNLLCRHGSDARKAVVVWELCTNKFTKVKPSSARVMRWNGSFTKDTSRYNHVKDFDSGTKSYRSVSVRIKSRILFPSPLELPDYGAVCMCMVLRLSGSGRGEEELLCNKRGIEVVCQCVCLIDQSTLQALDAVQADRLVARVDLLQG